MTSIRVMAAQINTTVGDLQGNAKKILSALKYARKKRADLVIFPELAVVGYPPEDLLFRRDFVDRNLKQIKELASHTRGLTAVAGFVDRDRAGKLYNAAAVMTDGKLRAVYHKTELPNYGVFDERRYFSAGQKPCIVRVGPAKVAVTICEDIWQTSSYVYRRSFQGKADLLVNLSASPYHQGKQAKRHALLRRLARLHRIPVIYENLVGGQDELVFDGGSFMTDASGKLVAEAELFKEIFLIADVPLGKVQGCGFFQAPSMSAEAEVYQALSLGTRDYVQKSGFKKVLIGLSGGIDSALVARIAVDALGASNVVGMTLPSVYTSKATYRDAKLLARRLGINCLEIRIDPIMRIYLKSLKKVFAGRSPDTTEENLQARIRGNLLMAMSNKYGYLVLTTGNKSEMATGYCTLYGDMAGGFAVIKDVPKTLVFKLARYRNNLTPKGSIPESILRRPPTAELKKNQTDQDTLPPYEILDPFLESYVENNTSLKTKGYRGLSFAAAKRVARMVKRNEYKRRQAPPGIKITPTAFGKDRRLPIVDHSGL